MLAHAPEQLLDMPVSFSNRYSVRPRPSTRTVPSVVWRGPTPGVAAAGRAGPGADPPGAARAAAPGGAVPVADPPPQPAAKSAAPASAAGTAPIAIRRFMSFSFRESRLR